uniref:Reverse transcriptase zinc-binding domain-containing protein n=1 Tax=Medicago truncatula TaxID=3880 RepID=A2Q1H1_MEDTR|nr:hypothetical protein MtrDRAFT_AC148816g38v2 [Medicago truncatula]
MMCLWKLKKDGVYTVKSPYQDILNHDVAVLQHRVPACHNCLPTRIRLQSKGVQCAVCDNFGEYGTHLFFMCSKSVLCWQRFMLSSPLMVVFDSGASFPTNVFSII